MKITKQGTWTDVLNAARTTVSRPDKSGDPSKRWRKQILLAEHSPIRLLTFGWTWQKIKSWVSVHFVRHKIGIEHFVSTQRTDRTGTDRNTSRQDSPVDHKCVANAQAMINISRKRLCRQASTETRKAWQEVVSNIEDDALASVMVPECVYRGFCPEYKKCGYSDTDAYKKRLAEYRNI